MYNLLIALAAGLAITAGVRLAGFSWLAGIVPGTIVFLAAFVLLARRIGARMQALSTEVQKELSVQPSSQKELQLRLDKAVKVLEGALPLSKWQFLLGPEIHAQIGMIRYMGKDFETAAVHLAKAPARNYMAQAIQAALCFQRKEFERMEVFFEQAVKSGRKEGLVWAAYAWCLLQNKEKEKAQKVLARAVDQNPSDEKLKSALTALQNDKKLKMKSWEPMWWQFGLEQPPLQAMGGRRVQFVRR